MAFENQRGFFHVEKRSANRKISSWLQLKNRQTSWKEVGGILIDDIDPRIEIINMASDGVYHYNQIRQGILLIAYSPAHTNRHKTGDARKIGKKGAWNRFGRL